MEVWIPSSARPKWTCRICGEKFYAGDQRARERHAAKCASENREVLEQVARHARPPELEPVDPEFAEWVRQFR